MLKANSRHNAILYSLIFTVVVVSLSVQLTVLSFNHAILSHYNLVTFSMGVALIVAPPCSFFMVLYTVKLIDLQEQLANLANTDVLTGALNRRSFTSMVEAEQHRIARTHAPAALLLMDADHFKRINSQYGHCAGDEVLKNITGIMQDKLRSGTDCLARWGGEEFVILLAETTIAQATMLGERLRLAIDHHETEFKNMKIKTTICIGVTHIAPDEDLGDAIERADICLFAAKHGGRNKLIATQAPIRQALVA